MRARARSEPDSNIANTSSPLVTGRLFEQASINRFAPVIARQVLRHSRFGWKIEADVPL